MNANILKLKEEAQQLRSLAEERALTSEETMRVERIAEQVRCEKLVDAFDAAPSVNIRQTNEEFAQLVADAVAGNRKIEVRAQNDKASVEPLTPVHIGDIIEPLEKGMILDKLREKGILDETLVIFTSDNGDVSIRQPADVGA